MLGTELWRAVFGLCGRCLSLFCLLTKLSCVIIETATWFGLIREPSSAGRPTLSPFIQKEITFFLVNFAQKVPIIHTEADLQRFYNLFKGQPGLTLPLHKLSQPFITCNLQYILNDLAQVLVVIAGFLGADRRIRTCIWHLTVVCIVLSAKLVNECLRDLGWAYLSQVTCVNH